MASGGNNGSSTGSPCGACKFLRRKCSADCIFAPYFCSEQGPARFAAIHKVFGASNVSKLLLHVPVPDRCEAVVTIAYEAQARIRDPVYGCVAHIFALQQQVACLQAQLIQAKAQLAQNLIDHHSRSVEDNNNQVWPGNINSNSNSNSNSNINININNNVNASSSSSSSIPSLLEGAAYYNSSSSSLYPNNNINYYMKCPISPDHHESSLESVDHNSSGTTSDLMMSAHEIQSCSSGAEDHFFVQAANCSRKRPNTTTTTDLGELQALALRMMRST